jgi:hypothetical protein
MTKKRKSPVRHKVSSHKRSGRPVKSYYRGKGQKLNKRGRPPLQPYHTKTKIKQKINWNLQPAEEMISAQLPELRSRAKIVWMTPESFLIETPCVGLPDYPAIIMKEKDYDSGSLTSIKKRIEKGKIIDPLYLDYSRMCGKFPAHEGRHRAFVAKQLGIKKVPVIVVKQRKFVEA